MEPFWFRAALVTKVGVPIRLGAIATVMLSVAGAFACAGGWLSPGYPRPYPRPFLCAKDWAGKDVFLWEGRRWYLPHNEEPYVFRRKDLSGVGRYRQTLLRCHARVPIRVRVGGVGEMRSVTAMIADRQFYTIDCSGA